MNTSDLSPRRAIFGLFISLIPIVGGGLAGTTDSDKASTLPNSAVAPSAKLDGYDRLAKLAILYKNDANPIVEEIKLRGRYHGQHHWLDSNQGNANGWEDRRSRFGIDAKFFDKKIEVRLDAQSTDGFDPFYGGLVDAYLKWKPDPAFNLTVGRQKPRLGYFDWLQSTNAQPTFERSQVFNQLRVDRASGAVAEGTLGRFNYELGAYSNDVDREFGQFEGGASFGAGVGWDFKEPLGVERADLSVHWLRSDHEEADTVLDRYDDLFSATFWIKQGRAGLVIEGFAGTGAGADAIGFYLQPTYDLLPGRVQVVGRYSFSHGDGADSVIAQSRYERSAPGLTGGGRGEMYHAGYLGLQYFLHGDNLKFLTGVEYARLDGGGNGGDFAGWTVFSGVRVSF